MTLLMHLCPEQALGMFFFHEETGHKQFSMAGPLPSGTKGHQYTQQTPENKWKKTKEKMQPKGGCIHKEMSSQR